MLQSRDSAENNLRGLGDAISPCRRLLSVPSGKGRQKKHQITTLCAIATSPKSSSIPASNLPCFPEIAPGNGCDKEPSRFAQKIYRVVVIYQSWKEPDELTVPSKQDDTLENGDPLFRRDSESVSVSPSANPPSELPSQGLTDTEMLPS